MFELDNDLKNEYQELIKYFGSDMNKAIKVARLSALSVLVALSENDGNPEGMQNDAFAFLRTFGGC